MEKFIYIYTDGGARGNPGPAASAFVVIEDGRIIHKDSAYLGVRTNNEAEYEAVIMAFQWLVSTKNNLIEKEIVFNLDSELITRQLMGLYKVKSDNLRLLITKIKILERRLNKKTTFVSVRREKNKIADTLVNKKLDEKTG